jgi:hypothetical protein
MSYAISENGLSWRAINSANDVLPGEVYSETEPSPPPPSAEDNKAIAKQLLQSTDWTQLPDAGLKNVSDFINYRATIRQIALSSTSGNIQWPNLPAEQW